MPRNKQHIDAGIDLVDAATDRLNKASKSCSRHSKINQRNCERRDSRLLLISADLPQQTRLWLCSLSRDMVKIRARVGGSDDVVTRKETRERDPFAEVDALPSGRRT